MDVIYFALADELRAWFAAHHGDRDEIWVGFYRKGASEPSVTYPEAVDEALCVGWIDGIRKRVDETRYTNRFTPRRKGSIWSTVNIARVAALEAAGRMLPAGRAAFEARTGARSGAYSFEQAEVAFDETMLAAFQREPGAWAFFQSQPPSYRRPATWWVISAKREETRARRLRTLIDDSANGLRIAPLRRP